MSLSDDLLQEMDQVSDRWDKTTDPKEKAQLNSTWQTLHILAGQAEEIELKDAAFALKQKVDKLQAIIDSADTDPLNYMINLKAITAALTKFISPANSQPVPPAPPVQQPPLPSQPQHPPQAPVSGGASSPPTQPSISPAPQVKPPPQPPSQPGNSPQAVNITQAATIKAILNIFETASVRGDYANVTVAQGDKGGLTYGRSQTTLNGGGLQELVADYCADGTRLFAQQLAAYLPQLQSKNQALNADIYLQNLLRAAADAEVMRDIQDRFFDRHYWVPACKAAARINVQTALGLAVVYDGFIQGSFSLIQQRTDAAIGPVSSVGEKAWVSQYVVERRAWLASGDPPLPATVYRMDAFRSLISAQLWDLPLPLVVRGLVINTASLAALPPHVYDGPADRSRILDLAADVMQGQDVRHVQVQLTAPSIGQRIKADGLFGAATQQAVRAFQMSVGLSPTGKADVATFAALKL